MAKKASVATPSAWPPDWRVAIFKAELYKEARVTRPDRDTLLFEFKLSPLADKPYLSVRMEKRLSRWEPQIDVAVKVAMYDRWATFLRGFEATPLQRSFWDEMQQKLGEDESRECDSIRCLAIDYMKQLLEKPQ